MRAAGVERVGDDSVPQVVRHMESALEAAARRFATGASADEAMRFVNDLIERAIELPSPLFLSMSPQAMVSALEMAPSDDRIVAKIAEALLVQAGMLQAEGSMNEAEARREQASAMLEFIDRSRAN